MRGGCRDVTRGPITSVSALPPPPLLLLVLVVAAATTVATTAATTAAATTTVATSAATTATLTAATAANITVSPNAGIMTMNAGPQENMTVFAGTVGWAGACELLAWRLREAGVRAVAMPSPAARDPHCANYARDSRLALQCTVQGQDDHTVWLGVPVGLDAVDALAQLWRTHQLRVVDAGDAAPPVHRACRSSHPGLAALDDLAHPLRLTLDWSLIERHYGNLNGIDVGVHDRFTPDGCNEKPCVTLLVSDKSEMKVMQDLVESAGLYARVLALGPRLPHVLTAHSRMHPSPPLLLCAWEPDLAEPWLAALVANWTRVTPPPCNSSDHLDEKEIYCPFEGRRLAKLVRESTLEQMPYLFQLLYDFKLNATDLEELGKQGSPTLAATNWRARHQDRVALWDSSPTKQRKLRIVVLLPLSGAKRTWDPLGLYAAAALAGDDMKDTLNVDVRDTQCSAVGAVTQVATQLSSSKYYSVSALAGPACGTELAAVAMLTKVFRLPVLAYTPVAVPDAHWALLAGGAGSDHAAALGALVQRLGWRRLAVLYDSGSHSLLDPDYLRADVVLKKELPDGEEGRVDEKKRLMIIEKWVEEARDAGVRVLLVAVEEEQLVRAALCAGTRAGLVPRNGTAWLLARAPRPTWLHDADNAECARAAAEGLLAVGPAWEGDWSGGAAHVVWTERWRDRRNTLIESTSQNVTAWNERDTPEPAAALLYDTLLLWARAWARANATAADAHRPEVLQSLIHHVIEDQNQNLTGRFKWSKNLVQTGEVRARQAALRVTQWRDDGGAHEVALWSSDKLGELTGLRWATRDGFAPNDGSPRCTLQPLADLLQGDCRAALAGVLSLVGLALLATLGGVALWGRRRREQVRLEQVRMRSLPKVDRWEVPRERIVINRKLGVGAFGNVYGGHAKLTGGGWTAVAVKTLRPGASIEDKADFLSEAETMKRFEHKNVVRLLGVVTQTEPVCTVMEYLLYADLKCYLLARRHLVGEAEADSEDEVSPRRLTSMALDAARALSYLAEKRYVHRDVAARNCLVSARRQLKLADFGMTRPVLDNDYYRFGRKASMPIRWMAPESLTQGVFSPASDIWAFGVLLYEMVTFGSLPYQGLSNSEVLAHVKHGGTLDLPPGLKPCLKALMKQCWLAAAAARPPAHEMVTFLADRPRLLTPCLDAPLDALPLAAETLRVRNVETHWEWGAPASVTTETTYLSDSPPEAACLLSSQ